MRTRPFITAFLLSLLAFLAPDLTLAPLNAVEPSTLGVRPIDEVREARRPGPVRLLDAEAGTLATAPVPALAPAPIADPAPYIAAIEAARAYGGAYGITFAAVRDGSVLWSGAAGRQRDGRTPLEGDDQLVIGSVTKTFVSAAILELVEAGLLSLDDRFADHLPGFRTVAPEITIRQLLNHTSGLADVFNDATKIGIETRPEQDWSTPELFATLHEPWYQPGVGYAYANTNYYLLGLLVEKLTGTTLADELSRRFFRPLDLDTTRVLMPDDGPGALLEPAWASIFWASGSMAASAADLARWGDALYGDAILTDASRTEMLTLNGASYGQDGENYGLGVQRIEIPGAVGYGHTGMLKTTTSLLLYLPDADVTLVLLVNRTHVDLGGMLAARPFNGPSLLELAGVELSKLAEAPPAP